MSRQRSPKIRRSGPQPEPAPGMRRVTINTVGDGFTSIDAWVFGEWAAHPRLGSAGDRDLGIWDVTYLPAGMNITSGVRGINRDRKFAERQAKLAADWLHAHLSRDDLYDWSSPSQEVLATVHQGIELASATVDEWMAIVDEWMAARST